MIFFNPKLKLGLPDLYNMFEEYTQLSPMQFASAPRCTFYYSEYHFTEGMD